MANVTWPAAASGPDGDVGCGDTVVPDGVTVGATPPGVGTKTTEVAVGC